MVTLWVVLTLVTLDGLSALQVRNGVNWNGNNWAMSCDFNGNDLSSAQIPGEQCSGRCAATGSCTHFTWTNHNGGTCWLKRGPISKANAVRINDPSAVCGVLNDSPVQPGVFRYDFFVQFVPSIQPIISIYRRGGKRGIAWPLENNQDSPNIFAGGKITWIYNWSPHRASVSGLEFVPMLWSTNKGHDGNLFYNQARGSKVVLGFNEPERGDQANMNPAEAARAWKQFIEPLRDQGARLGSPGIASTNEGLNWLKQFLTELTKVGGRVDFLALHWYGRGADNFINWITRVRQELGNRYPVWVTEFACTSWNPSQPVSQQEIDDFMKQSLQRMDSLDWVERYSWFGAQRRLDAALGSGNVLIGSNGQLSALGRKYVHDY